MLCTSISMQQSRNISSTWKKSHSSSLYASSKTTVHSTELFAHSNRACLCYSPRLLSSTAKFAYTTVRTKCHQYLHSVANIPHRFLSYKKPWDSVLSTSKDVSSYFKSGNASKPLNSDRKQYVMNYAHTNFNTRPVDNSMEKTISTNQNIVLPKYSFSSTGNLSPVSENGLNENLHEPKNDADKNSENVQNNEEDFSEDDIQSKKHSQYDHLISSVKKQQEAEKEFENTLLNSVKTAFTAPVNSFFSLLSHANIFERSDEKQTKQTVDKDMSKPDESGVIHPSANSPQDDALTKEPVSLLDSLYQYVPYVFSGSNNATDAKEKDVQKKTSRIQADRFQVEQRVSINNRTRYLIQCIRDTNSMLTLFQRVEELKDHLLRFPDTRITAVKENAIREIMHIYRTSFDKDLLPLLRVTLAMLGAVDPPKRKGIRILTIDGGGCRGVLSVEIFRRLVELSGQPIHEMFDYICGVSTGAILGFLLGLKKIPIESLGPMYRSFSAQVFEQNKLVGTGKLVISHAFYNTETYQRVLREIMGDTVMIETASNEDTPKCSAVSTLVNRMVLKPFVWRNYSIVPGTRHTHWPGTCRGTIWEAVRASSAAPGYFEEFKKGTNIHQDGGLLTNNPTGVALNECSLLWPNSPIQCVVSVGTGRYEPTIGPTSEQFLSLKDKLLKVVDSATSVSEVHTVMYDLLPPYTYFRFNPYIKEPLLLDDFHPEKLDMLVEDAHEYIARNEHKFQACVDTLFGKKPHKTR